MPSRIWLCTYCGTETEAPVRPGSNWIAAVLAVPTIVPALLYLAWRYSTRRFVCPVCAHAQLIPGDAPLARTWRSAGWVPGQSLPGAVGTTDPRIERIEQAIDAIANEVDRVSRAQRDHSLGPGTSPGRPR
jgi:hypothetical protein